MQKVCWLRVQGLDEPVLGHRRAPIDDRRPRLDTLQLRRVPTGHNYLYDAEFPQAITTYMMPSSDRP